MVWNHYQQFSEILVESSCLWLQGTEYDTFWQTMRSLWRLIVHLLMAYITYLVSWGKNGLCFLLGCSVRYVDDGCKIITFCSKGECNILLSTLDKKNKRRSFYKVVHWLRNWKFLISWFAWVTSWITDSYSLYVQNE